MSQTQLADQLKTTARIDMIRQAQFNLNVSKRAKELRERLEDAKELNFDDLLQGER